MRIQSRDQNGNFANSRWRTAAILNIALSQYLSRESSDFDQVWYADVDFNSKHGYLTHKKSKFCKFKMADGRHIEIVFGYITSPYWPMADWCEIWIGNEESHVDICDVNKAAIFANSRWRTPAILKIVFFCILAPFQPMCVKVGQQSSSDQNSNFRQFNMAAAAMLKVVFRRLGYPSLLLSKTAKIKFFL